MYYLVRLWDGESKVLMRGRSVQELYRELRKRLSAYDSVKQDPDVLKCKARCMFGDGPTTLVIVDEDGSPVARASFEDDLIAEAVRACNDDTERSH